MITNRYSIVILPGQQEAPYLVIEQSDDIPGVYVGICHYATLEQAQDMSKALESLFVMAQVLKQVYP